MLKADYARNFSQNSLSLSLFSGHSIRNGYPTLFRGGDGEGGKGEEWRPTSVTPLLIQADSLTASYLLWHSRSRKDLKSCNQELGGILIWPVSATLYGSSEVSVWTA